jgi:predicted small lipoprotein YifL
LTNIHKRSKFKQSDSFLLKGRRMFIMKKKVLSCLLALSMVASLVACGNEAAPTESKAPEASKEEAKPSEPAAAPELEEDFCRSTQRCCPARTRELLKQVVQPQRSQEPDVLYGE